MNEYQYDELLNYVKNIGQFRDLVKSESKRPVAVRTLMHVSGTDSRTAWDFVNEFYDRMDIKFISNMNRSNDMKRNNNENIKLTM